MEDLTPGVDAPDDALDDAPEVAQLVAPAVVAVVVAHDPGEWFEATIASLTAQDYPSLSVLVIDTASAVEVRARVAAVAPSAFVRRLDENPGFGAAANEVLEVVEGAAFYLFCHDDVALDPDVVRLLVEEAFRSNAAVVGPKLVSWDDPRHLLDVGVGIDHAGYVAPLVERGELDQEQHDGVRDVFAIPGACTLVRADLFAAVGGFDEGIDYLLDDISLCWRVHLAGARVIVAPSARVRHLEALSIRRPVDDRRRLQARHRLRVVLSCYSAVGLVRIVPKMVALHVVEILYSLVVGRTAQARDTAAAWTWNLRNPGELREARRQVDEFRVVPDREIRRFMVGGSARFRQFARGQIGGGEDRLTGWARSGRDVAGALRTGSLRNTAIVWSVIAFVLLAGSRHLITRGVPAVGELVPFRSSSIELLRAWVSGWRSAGLGSEAPAPTAYGLGGFLGILSFGSMGLLRTVLTLGLLPLGALTIYRLAAPVGSRHAQIAALVVYVCNPLPYNALANGRWGALALYAGVPALIGMLARAGGIPPFTPVTTDDRAAPRPSLRTPVLALGATTALLATLIPAAVLILPGLALALGLGSLFTYRVFGTSRMVAVAFGGAVLAIALHLPWSADLLLPGTPWSAIVGVDRGSHSSDLGALLRFQVGPMGVAPLGWALLIAAALPLLIARAERHAWAVRGWVLALVFWALAWISQSGWAPSSLPAPEVLLAPSAVGLALATAMGVAAFEVDLPGYRFGWRQIASGVAAVAVALATIPVLGAAFDGRWSMPGGDHQRALSFIDLDNETVPFRILWLGDPAALPLGSWELTDGVAYSTTDHGTPRLEDLWVGSDDGVTGLLADVIDLARTGQTARLGRLLAPMGVRYIVVPERLAPAPFASDALPIPEALADTLDGQLDLEPLDLPAGVLVFRNQAFYPMRAQITTAKAPPAAAGVVAAAGVDLSGLGALLPKDAGTFRWSGPVQPDKTLLWAAAHSDRWTLSVDGRSMAHTKPYGWANGFDVTSAGDATLRYATSPVRYGLLLLQVLAWLWVGRRLLRSRLNPARAAEETS
ncbi:MAG: glycosyltransferase family 2 protein [Acidimicrobiales bacterium]